MNKKHKNEALTPEEIQLFRHAMAKIKPIKKDKTLLKKKPVLNKKLPNYDFMPPKAEPYLSDFMEEEVSAEQILFFSRTGISQKQLKQLKLGKIRIAATLDLHGFTAEAARSALINFIDAAHHNNLKCVAIIHGKGHTEIPVLKNRINSWLRQLSEVLAFCTAQPRHGGTGAVYVLLKSSA